MMGTEELESYFPYFSSDILQEAYRNILKIRAFLVNDTNKGIGTTYLELIDDIAFNNNIDYIYLTIKKNNNKLIRFMEKNDYKKYSNYNDEFVYYKDLNNIIK